MTGDPSTGSPAGSRGSPPSRNGGNQQLYRTHAWVPFICAAAITALTYALLFRTPIPLQFDAAGDITLELLFYPGGRSQFSIEPGAVLGLLPALFVGLVLVKALIYGSIGLAGGIVARSVVDRTDSPWRLPRSTALRLALYPCLLEAVVWSLAVVAIATGTILSAVLIAVLAIVSPRLFFVVPAIALEDRSVPASIATSWERTRGNWLRFLGVVLVLVVFDAGLRRIPHVVPLLQDYQSATFPVGTFLSISVVGTVYAVTSARWYEATAPRAE